MVVGSAWCMVLWWKERRKISLESTISYEELLNCYESIVLVHRPRDQIMGGGTKIKIKYKEMRPKTVLVTE